MAVPHVAPPEMPPVWERDRFTPRDRLVWALAYGDRYADLCEREDRRLGVTLALSAASRRRRRAVAARRALAHWRDVESLRGLDVAVTV